MNPLIQGWLNEYGCCSWWHHYHINVKFCHCLMQFHPKLPPINISTHINTHHQDDISMTHICMKRQVFKQDIKGERTVTLVSHPGRSSPPIFFFFLTSGIGMTLHEVWITRESGGTLRTRLLIHSLRLILKPTLSHNCAYNVLLVKMLSGGGIRGISTFHSCTKSWKRYCTILSMVESWALQSMSRFSL